MLAERLFILGLLVIALVAAIYAAPKAVRLSIGYGTHIGGPDDESFEGSSLVAKMLTRLGYNVVLEPEPGRVNATSVLYFISNPTRCSPQVLQWLINEMGRLIVLGSRVSLVISDETICASSLIGLLGISQPITYSVSPRDYVVFTQSGTLFALHTVMATEITGKWVVAGYTYPDALPGILVYNSSAYTIVYVPDSHAFTNAVLLAENETGLNPLAELSLVMGLAGAQPGDTTIVIPLYMYQQEYTAAQVATKIQPGILVLEALSSLSIEEHRFIKMLENIPGALAAASLVIAAPMYLVMREALGGTRETLDMEEERYGFLPRTFSLIADLPRYRPAPLRLNRVAKNIYAEIARAWQQRYNWSLYEEEARPRRLSSRELAALRRLGALASSKTRCLLVLRPRKLVEEILDDLALVIEDLQRG